MDKSLKEQQQQTEGGGAPGGRRRDDDNENGGGNNGDEESLWKKKRRKGNRRNISSVQIRSRPNSSDGDDDDVLEKLNAIREAQTLRASFKRKGGIQVDSTDNSDGYAPEAKRARDSDGNEIGTTADGKYLAGLNSSHAARAGDITDHTSRMEKYIQQKINEFQETRREQEVREQKIRQGASLDEWGNENSFGDGSGGAQKDGTKYESYEAKQKRLFEIPEEYKAESKLIKDSQNKIAWITGISEVELPLDYKLKNIRDTEEAKKKLLCNPVASKSADRKFYRFTDVTDK